jgi:6-phosphogluconate dehydrogenase-like protein
MKSIGFIGLGKMGSAMADNLLKAGFDLHVYNRTPGKVAALVAQGAKLAHEPSHTAHPGGIVITMLANDRAVEDIVSGDQGFVERLGPEGIHLSMNTVSPRLARRLAEEHRRYGVEYLAAPVFGRPEAAAARKLWICLSGSPTAKQRVRPISIPSGKVRLISARNRRPRMSSSWRGTSCWPPPLKRSPRRWCWEKKTESIEANWRTCWAVPCLPALPTKPTAVRSRSSIFDPQASLWSWD